MGESSRRTLVRGPGHFPTPHGDALAHAPRRELQPKIRPIGCKRRIVEARHAVEAVEKGADKLAVFHADTGIVAPVGHAAGGIELIVGTAKQGGFRLESSAVSTMMRTPKPFFSGSLFFAGSMSRFQISSYIGPDL